MYRRMMARLTTHTVYRVQTGYSFLLFFFLLFLLGVSAPVNAEQNSRARLEALIKKASNEQPQTQAASKASAVPQTPAEPKPSAPTAGSGLGEALKSAQVQEGSLPPEESNNEPTVVIDTSDYEIPPPRAPTLRDQAFKELLDKISPLTPEQIVEMRKVQDKTQRAVATTPDAPPKPVSSTLTIDLSPGVTPPVIRLGAGYVSSFVFVDSTGQPWPIADYSLGNPKNFNIQWDKKSNTLFVQSTSAYNSGNLAVRLATLDTPVMLSLVSGQRDVDYRIDLQVLGRGPNALAAVVETLPSPPPPMLLSVLDGVPPPGSLELMVSAGCGKAWLYKGRMIFRTHLKILSPAWISTVSSLDGTHVYEMNPTPLILASQNGKTVKIAIVGL